MQEPIHREPASVTPSSLLEMVREGMKVVDAAGEEIGKVELVRFGDPQATTTAGTEYRPGGFVEQMAEAIAKDESEPDVPEPLKARLVRTGFIKIDGKGFFSHDHYAAADQIDAVADDSVRLAVVKDRLHTED